MKPKYNKGQKVREEFERSMTALFRVKKSKLRVKKSELKEKPKPTRKQD